MLAGRVLWRYLAWLEGGSLLTWITSTMAFSTQLLVSPKQRSHSFSRHPVPATFLISKPNLPNCDCCPFSCHLALARVGRCNLCHVTSAFLYLQLSNGWLIHLIQKICGCFKIVSVEQVTASCHTILQQLNDIKPGCAPVFCVYKGTVLAWYPSQTLFGKVLL